MKDLKTNRDIMNAMTTYATENEINVKINDLVTITSEDFINFAQKTLAQMDRKNAYAKSHKRTSKSAKANLEMAKEIVTYLDTPKNNKEICNKFGLSAPKTTAIMKVAVDNGLAQEVYEKTNKFYVVKG